MTLYRKHFIALESDPDVFNELIRLLGAPQSLQFEDVLSLDGPHLFPRPVLALILIFPTTEGYERRKDLEDATCNKANYVDDDGVVWYKQTINNACGLYAILHALSNGEAREVLSKLYFVFYFRVLDLMQIRDEFSHREHH
jgi:ubiquitin carboxyl-terminal hydrolase L3